MRQHDFLMHELMPAVLPARNVACWHQTDMLQRSVHVCYQGKNGPTSDTPQGPLMSHFGRKPSMPELPTAVGNF
jgi:hypothetical protein